ncbi:MAG: T9SS type A sorting domain-containing protein [Bergeyella sp.]
MKKLLLFPFLLIASLSFSQHPELLNTNWQITKFENEILPEQLPPPMPYQQVTQFSETPQYFNLSFFNTVAAGVTFQEEGSFHKFTVNNKGCTLADYAGDNGEVNQFFGFLCNFFQDGWSYYYYITNNGSEKTLIIDSPIFERIYFKSVNLSTTDQELSQYYVAPNPVKNTLTVKNPSAIHAVQIFDLSGKLMYEAKNENTKSLNIDMSNFKTGNYLIKLNNDKTYKIIKE